uniref:LRRCT domain-containing protein n=1 Tax=Graphocephala atropunctata TaxID=36148 RepID=A0A1B6M0J8_9HEMI
MTDTPSYVDPQTFPSSPLPKLLTADFHHNPLELILPYTFQIMNNTEQLYLGGKHARLQIRQNSFLGLVKVRKVSLNGINLEVLEREYLKGMPRLRELKMEGTIRELSFDAFAEAPKLQELILKQCSIHKISMDAFFGLYDLVYLDLSQNELETLPPSLFDQQESLKEINLSNNKLTTLPESLFVHVPAKLIRLDKNPWHCTCSMYEWKPSQINKVKVKVIDNSLCQSRYDKNSMCQVRYMYRYMYEQSVTPRCASPSRFSGWSVFHLLRKHLRCYKKFHKQAQTTIPTHTNKLHKKFPKIHKNLLNSSTSTQIPTTDEVNEQNILPNEKHTSSFDQKTSKPLKISSTNKLVTEDNEHIAETSALPTTEGNNNGTLEINNDEPESPNTLDINQNMWTQKDRDKYRLLQNKHERIQQQFNSTVTDQNDNPVQTNVRMNIDMNSKTKKRADTQKKWTLKMENTVRRSNKVPTN